MNIGTSDWRWDGLSPFSKTMCLLYPLVIQQVAFENGPVEIMSFPIKHGGSFHSFPNKKQWFSIVFPFSHIKKQGDFTRSGQIPVQPKQPQFPASIIQPGPERLWWKMSLSNLVASRCSVGSCRGCELPDQPWRCWRRWWNLWTLRKRCAKYGEIL